MPRGSSGHSGSGSGNTSSCRLLDSGSAPIQELGRGHTALQRHRRHHRPRSGDSDDRKTIEEKAPGTKLSGDLNNTEQGERQRFSLSESVSETPTASTWRDSAFQGWLLPPVSLSSNTFSSGRSSLSPQPEAESWFSVQYSSIFFQHVSPINCLTYLLSVFPSAGCTLRQRLVHFVQSC